MPNIQVFGARGGHGATTLSLLLGRFMYSTVHDLANNGGFNVSDPTAEKYGSWSPVERTFEHSTTHAVYDCGTLDNLGGGSVATNLPPWTEAIDLSVIVLRGPDYLGLRSIMKHKERYNNNNFVVMVVEEDGRSLTKSDAELVTGLPTFSMSHSPAIARANDSGLIASNSPATGATKIAFHEIGIMLIAMFPDVMRAATKGTL